jgi:mono/diheme cytochrome c family protein
MPSIPNFTNASWQHSRSNVELMISILEGRNRLMPANRGVVSDSQAADLVAFIRRFDPSRPAPTRSTAVPGVPSRSGPARGGPMEPASTDFEVQFNQLVKQYDDLERQLKEVSLAPVTESVSKEPFAELPARRTGGPSSASAADNVSRFFQQTCARCHTIGGGALSGPDLKNVSRRTSRARLVQLLLNPNAVSDRGDPPGLQLRTYGGAANLPHRFKITRERAEGVLDFIDAESQKEKSPFASLPFSDRPHTADDVERGRELFIGQRPLANGGPSCIACHATHGMGGLEGGRLGPDLTKVYERLGGRNALTAHIWAAPTPTMLPVYQQHPLESEEVVALAAYLEQRDREGVEEAASVPLTLLLWGLGGTVLGLVVINVLFGWRFRPWKEPALNGKLAVEMPIGHGPLPLSQERGADNRPIPMAQQNLTQSSEEYVAPGL